MARILVVDDDGDIREVMRMLLAGAGHDVRETGNADDAIRMLRAGTEKFSLIVLDVTMPQKDGFQACTEIRTFCNLPILFLTARGQEYDKIRGFGVGGDDYLVKPFMPSELLARIGAMLRRYTQYGGGEPERKAVLTVGELRIDEDARRVTVGGEEKTLTATEYAILLLLCKTRGKIFSARNIYESVWNEPYLDVTDNTITVHIRNIRGKIEKNPQKPEYLKTVWGMGYRIE